MLANIMREGSFGQFEIAGDQRYLQYFINNHDYVNRFSRKYIYDADVTIKELYDMARSRPSGAENVFGLGVIQWTDQSRFFHLLEEYERVSGGTGRITLEQVIEAESQMMIQELRSGSHTSGRDVPRFSYLPDIWRVENAGNLNSAEAARSAASMITRNYLKPSNAATKAVTRGEDAVSIFDIMMKNSTANPFQTPHPPSCSCFPPWTTCALCRSHPW
jgi:hypothetical protein